MRLHNPQTNEIMCKCTNQTAERSAGLTIRTGNASYVACVRRVLLVHITIASKMVKGHRDALQEYLQEKSTWRKNVGSETAHGEGLQYTFVIWLNLWMPSICILLSVYLSKISFWAALLEQFYHEFSTLYGS